MIENKENFDMETMKSMKRVPESLAHKHPGEISLLPALNSLILESLVPENVSHHDLFKGRASCWST